MAFFIGQKVTPINDDPWEVDLECNPGGPPFGSVVTISDIVCWEEDDETCLVFAEWPQDDIFSAEAFRPVTDIGIFQKMLDVREIETL